MILYSCSNPRYLYDIHSLLKSFFPAEEVKDVVVYQKEVEKKNNKIRYNDKNKTSDNITDNIKYTVDVSFDEAARAVKIDIYSGEKLILSDRSEYTLSDTNSEKDASTNGSRESFTTPKNILKTLLYKMLVKLSGRTLPWGSLTGIRPTKIAYNMLEKSNDEKEIKNYLKNIYNVSDKKADLSIEIAGLERSILEAFDYKSGYSLYMGIPFCPTRCGYCSFAAYPLASFKNIVDDYLDCLEKELSACSRIMKDVRLDTIYIGGGTPTTLSAAQSDRLLCFIEKTFDLSHVKEFTVEAGRPDSILDDRDKLRVLRAHGVDRICVNPQTFKQETLDAIGRGHTVEETERAYFWAREMGFDNINMDIILGLPGEGVRDVEHTADELCRLKPDDLTVHSLSLKRGSAMQAKISEELAAKKYRAGLKYLNEFNIGKGAEETGSYEYVLEDESSEMLDIIEAAARSMKLRPYYLYRQKNISGNMENTGYAREGAYGLSNMLGMEEVHSVVACGAGAVTKCVSQCAQNKGLISRTGNAKDILSYMKGIDEIIKRKEELFCRR